jgi:azurin
MNYSWSAVALLGLMTSPAWSADDKCAAAIEGTDAMQFSTHAIEIPKSCKQFTVTLKHAGTLPKAAMGHNWVLSRTADEAGITADGVPAGLSNDYLKPGDARVIAHTKVVGGGESDSTTFSVSALKVNESYEFFCSFPGHVSLMKGTVTVAK